MVWHHEPVSAGCKNSFLRKSLPNLDRAGVEQSVCTPKPTGNTQFKLKNMIFN